jgi:23S rRNA pseudouridine955/2504/2580 synthase
MGFPKPGDGILELPLVKRGVGDREMVMPAEPGDPRAEAAETEFVTIARAGPRAAWMALRPHTGRTHQLRAHMLAMGHPILGDPKYATHDSQELSGDLKLQLHARRLVIAHPSRGQLVLEAPISPEMRAGFARFGFHENEAGAEPFGKARRK